MTTPTPPHAPRAHSEPSSTDQGLTWLLREFTGRVAGVTCALLVSRDGLAKAVSGLDDDRADRAAAWVSSLHSLARSAATVAGAQDGGFRQVVIEDAGVLVFVVSADHAATTETGSESGLVGCVLGVLAEPDADLGVVGHEITLLVNSVGEHLTTPTRGGRNTGEGR
jgi:predicted regulator of Ras-like GTPase activity (Roadblock/LC7/MglB family)